MKNMIVFSLVTTCLLMTGIAQEVGIAARVNGVEITVFRLERFFDEYSKNNGGGFQLITNPAVYKRVKRQALDQLIDREVLWQEAQRRKIEVNDEQVKAAMNELERKFKSRDAYLRKLGTMGFNEETYAAYVRQDIAIESMMETGLEADPVVDSDLEEFYSKNPEQFVRPETALARHILIKAAPDAGDAVRRTARERADRILAELKTGKNFDDLARQYSEDSTAGEGGALGWFERHRMVKPFDDAVFGLEPGQISDIVETAFGFHIIKLEEKRPAGNVLLSEVKEQLRKYLEGVKRQEAGQKLLERLRSEATIERVLRL